MADADKPGLPVPIAPPEPAREPRARSGFAAFAAQVMGAGVRKRGLKGGPPVVEEARATYLETEYSGPNDRRPAVGRIARKDV